VSKCQSRINARSKEQLYSITSSARASRVDGRRRQWDVRYASIATALVDRIATDAVRQTGTMTLHTYLRHVFTLLGRKSRVSCGRGLETCAAIKNKKMAPCVRGHLRVTRESQEATFVLTALAAGVCLVTTFLFLEP
jgi:hypothetical protein